MTTLPRQLFCDSSFFYACLDPRDANHAAAKSVLIQAEAVSAVFWTTWDVISETVTLLRYRRNFRTALSFLGEVKPAIRIVRYGESVYDEAEEVFRRYGQQRRLSFCDAISFVVVTTLLDDMPCFAFDQDFRRLGLTTLS